MGHSKVPQRWCDGEVGCFPLTLGVRCYKVSNPYPTHRGPLYRGGMHQSINVISIQREIPMNKLREDDIEITEIEWLEWPGQLKFPLTPYQHQKMLTKERTEHANRIAKRITESP